MTAETNKVPLAVLYQAVAQVLAFVYRMRSPVRAPRPSAASAGPRQGQVRKVS